MKGSAQYVQHPSHRPCAGVLWSSLVRLPQPAQLSPLQCWEPSPTPSSICLQALRRAYPARRLQAPIELAATQSPSSSSKWARHSRQAKDIFELKSQMALVLEYLIRQQALPPALASAPPLTPAPGPTPLSPVAIPDVSEQDVAMSEEEQDAISIAASWDGDSFPQEETGPRTNPGDWYYPSLNSSIPVFLDFLEEVQSSWHRPASAPSVSKQAAPLASLDGEGALGLAEFLPVDSTIVALVRAPPIGDLSKDLPCPNAQCRITEAHLKKAYAAKAQVSSFEGQALGQSLAGLIVAQTALAVPGKGPGYRQVGLAGRTYLPWPYIATLPPRTGGVLTGGLNAPFPCSGGRGRDADVEYMLVAMDHNSHKVRLVLSAGDVLHALQEKGENTNPNHPTLWRPEYGSYMIEGTPGQPYGGTMSEFNTVEDNMGKRRREASSLLKENQTLCTITAFPSSVIYCNTFSVLFLFIAVFKDKNTPSPFVETFPTDDGEAERAALPDHIYMDCMGFGMGNSCLQVTFQACSISEARYLYDQLATICPIVPLKHNKYRISKSRYDSIDSYLSSCGEKYNDIELTIDEEINKQLLEAGIDKLLAQHIAHLFIRDPLTLFEEKIHLDDENESDHFENIQSTNWQTMRFKPPPPNSDIGWRVEFRPMEVQLTDFENSAYVVFVVLLTRVILSYKLDFLIPLSKAQLTATTRALTWEGEDEHTLSSKATMQPPKSYSIGGQCNSRAAYRQARRRSARLQGSLVRGEPRTPWPT
ncbi:UNVERIFIED_CONTAM: hypothetical protein FKN15_040115 [Acipenser sinensis]